MGYGDKMGHRGFKWFLGGIGVLRVCGSGFWGKGFLGD